MPSDRTLNDLLGTLYAAPMSPELWPEVLSSLSATLDLNAGAIVHTDLECKANGVYTSWGVDPEIERLYAAGYGNDDVYRPRFLRARARHGALLMGDDLCSFKDAKKTAFGQDILRRADIRLWCAVSTVHTETVIENISLFHSWNEEPPGNEKLELARLLAPHLNNALRVRARLTQLEGLSGDLHVALDKADTAIVLFDQRGRCALINQTAKMILDRRDGLIFADNRIAATNADESASLLETIRRAVAGFKRKEQPNGEAVWITRRGRRPLQVRVAPFPCERLSGSSHFAAIAFIGNPDKGTALPLAVLRASYGLTPAEAKLAILLLEGRSVTEAADLNNVSKETVRTQLKSIFVKTGTRRQGELIGVLAALPGQIA